MEPMENKNSGNTPRNRYRDKAGDFVMFADDDNFYTTDALQTIRGVIQHDRHALYIFQAKFDEDLIIPRPGNGEVQYGNVDSGRSRCVHAPSPLSQEANCT